MLDPIQNINFGRSPSKRVPAVLQDYITGKVLTLGFMDRVALQETQQTGMVNFYTSNDRNEKMRLAEVKLRQILADCDRNALLVKVETSQPFCDSGADTCWSEKNHREDFLSYLEQIIHLRSRSHDSSSYVRQLFSGGPEEITVKVREACRDLCDAVQDVNQALFLEKAADLLFHYIVLLQVKNCSLAGVTTVLQKRHQTK